MSKKEIKKQLLAELDNQRQQMNDRLSQKNFYWADRYYNRAIEVVMCAYVLGVISDDEYTELNRITIEMRHK